jgi:putative oxidoreductase
MDLVFLIGRSLLGLVFILAGIQVHLVARKQSAEMARGVGVPFPEISVPLTGIIIVVAGLMVALGVWPDLAAILLILFLVSAAYFFHAFWRIEDPQEQGSQTGHFMKNMGLVGASLIIFFIYNQLQGSVPLSLVGPLFGPIGPVFESPG